VHYQPKKPLIPGEYYFVDVDMGATLIQDQYGASVAPTFRYLRAPTVLSATDSALQYAWATVSDAGALGSSYVADPWGGATERYSFKGTSHQLMLWGAPNGGQAQIDITSAHAATITQIVDTYAPSGGDLTYSWPSLPSGSHTVTITVIGAHNPSSTGNSIGVDATVTNGVTTESPTLTAQWAPLGDYEFTGQASASVTLFYRGRGLVWRAFVGENEGEVAVAIDGNPVGTFDLYNADFTYTDFALTLPSINDTFHTLTITALGTHDAASSDTIVTMNRITLD
jgi:hypothetical protein